MRGGTRLAISSVAGLAPILVAIGLAFAPLLMAVLLLCASILGLCFTIGFTIYEGLGD